LGVNRFTSDEDYGFTKTEVPVKLMRYGDDNLDVELVPNDASSEVRRMIARAESLAAASEA